MRRRKWLMSGLALLTGGGLAAAIPALPAVGQSSPPSSPIVLIKHAPVKDLGVVVNVSAYVVCGAGDSGSLGVNLIERVGKRTTFGNGYQTFPCSGQIETVKVPVTVAGGLHIFDAGPAYAQVTLNDCAYYYCNTASKNGTVTLTTKK